MFTLLRNFRTMFMLTVANYQESPEGAAPVAEEATSPEALKAMIESAEFAEIEGITQEQIKDLHAAHEHFSQGGVVSRENKSEINGAIAKDIQEMLIYVGHQMLSVDGTKNYGADGDFGGASTRATIAFQEANGLDATGVVDATTYAALLNAVRAKRINSDSSLSQEVANDAIAALEETGNMRPTARPEGLGEEVATEEIDDSAITEMAQANEIYTSEHALAALEAIKTDRNAVKAIQEAVGASVDGISGPNTRAAVEAKPAEALDAIAKYIDETDNESVAARLISEKPAAGDDIDAALTEWMNGDPSTTAMQAIVEEFTGNVDSHTRNANAQYISLWLQANGHEDDNRSGQIMEAVMAEGAGHYEQETTELQIRQALHDGSGRFATHLGSFPENFNGSYYRVRQTLQGANGRTRVENGMEEGLSGNAGEILHALFGVNGEFVATRVHVVTGQGRDGDADMSVEIANGIELSNAYYDEQSGAIYAVVAKGNGCEGNLVVIPVEPFVPPAPRPVVPPRTNRTPQPADPTEPVDPTEPEEPDAPGRTCRTDTKCQGGYVYIRQRCWDANTFGRNQVTGPWEKTPERCTPPDDDDDNGSVSTTTGTEGTGPTGTPGGVAEPDTGSTTDSDTGSNGFGD